MKKFTSILLLAAACFVGLVLSGCSKIPDEGTLTVCMSQSLPQDQVFRIYPMLDAKSIPAPLDSDVSMSTSCVVELTLKAGLTSVSATLNPGNYFVYRVGSNDPWQGAQVQRGHDTAVAY